MQMKKFEARSMKEALEMIKTQLGPDAIILSAKEMTKGFGLGGEKSIEVTAAYSETILQKKKFVESKLPVEQKEKFQKIPAKNQKEVMRKAIEQHVAKINSQNGPTRNMPAMSAVHQNKLPTATAIPYKMTEKRYIDIDNENGAGAPLASSLVASANMTDAAKQAWNNMEVSSLKEEIESLKKLIDQFKSVPQSFVQAHPGAEFGVNYSMSHYFQNLIRTGISAELAGQMLIKAQSQLSPQQVQNKSLVESWLAKHMLDNIHVTNDVNEQFHLFIGPSGSGKTSSLVKLASELILNHKKRVAIISTDISKVGAAEQMKIFAQILNVPFLSIRSQQDWGLVLPHLDQLDSILVDYAGLNLKSQDEASYIKRMSPPVYKSVRTHLVLSCLSKDSDLIETAGRYGQFGFDDVIFTGLDEATQHGGMYNLVQKLKCELFAFGIGAKVPEDFEMATAERIVDLLMKITQSNKQEMSA